jgi:serine/threonine protein kinase
VLDFKLIKQVGKGSFGVVRKCRSYLDNKIYALKSIQMDAKVMDESKQK